jgi:hypothetical protein
MERGSTIMIRCTSVLLEGKEMMGEGIFLVRLSTSRKVDVGVSLAAPQCASLTIMMPKFSKMT